MEAKEALRILRILADGANPVTGEVFAQVSPLQHPQVVRALYTAVAVLAQVEARRQRERLLPENAGKPWVREEDDLLRREFDEGLTTDQLARKHKRTASAIGMRLERLGKIPPYPRPGIKS